MVGALRGNFRVSCGRELCCQLPKPRLWLSQRRGVIQPTCFKRGLLEPRASGGIRMSPSFQKSHWHALWVTENSSTLSSPQSVRVYMWVCNTYALCLIWRKHWTMWILSVSYIYIYIENYSNFLDCWSLEDWLWGKYLCVYTYMCMYTHMYTTHTHIYTHTYVFQYPIS